MALMALMDYHTVARVACFLRKQSRKISVIPTRRYWMSAMTAKRIRRLERGS